MHKTTGGCRRVMVVDDDAVNLMLAGEVLRLFSVDTVACSSGEQALSYFVCEPFGLVLMDVQMPGLNGLEVTDRMRHLEVDTGRPRTPIVALTASAMPEELQACLRRGMDDVLCKPFDIAALRALLQRWSIVPALGVGRS